MQAKETKLQDIIEGTKQYIIPLFNGLIAGQSKNGRFYEKTLLNFVKQKIHDHILSAQW